MAKPNLWRWFFGTTESSSILIKGNSFSINIYEFDFVSSKPRDRFRNKMTGWGAGWDKGDTRFPRRSPVAEAGGESLCLHSHSPLSPFQLQHAIPSPTAVSVALVHINSAEPLSCKESPTPQGRAFTSSCLPGRVIHISSCSLLLPHSHTGRLSVPPWTEFFPIPQ